MATSIPLSNKEVYDILKETDYSEEYINDIKEYLRSVIKYSLSISMNDLRKLKINKKLNASLTELVNFYNSSCYEILNEQDINTINILINNNKTNNDNKITNDNYN